jgi:hypothetical protein
MISLLVIAITALRADGLYCPLGSILEESTDTCPMEV